jgi:hypothetical protein
MIVDEALMVESADFYVAVAALNGNGFPEGVALNEGVLSVRDLRTYAMYLSARRQIGSEPGDTQQDVLMRACDAVGQVIGSPASEVRGRLEDINFRWQYYKSEHSTEKGI